MYVSEVKIFKKECTHPYIFIRGTEIFHCPKLRKTTVIYQLWLKH